MLAYYTYLDIWVHLTCFLLLALNVKLLRSVRFIAAEEHFENQIYGNWNTVVSTIMRVGKIHHVPLKGQVSKNGWHSRVMFENILCFTGFDESSTVTIGSNCEVLSSTYTTITCVTNAHTLGTTSVIVTTGSTPLTLANAYTYEASTATITGFAPQTLSATGGIIFFHLLHPLSPFMMTKTAAKKFFLPVTVSCHLIIAVVTGQALGLC